MRPTHAPVKEPKQAHRNAFEMQLVGEKLSVSVGKAALLLPSLEVTIADISRQRRH
jgi:hypothetical protein